MILNGMITHAGPPPEHWDIEHKRPLKDPVQKLKDAGIEVVFVYYWESVYSPLHHKFAVFDDHTVITESYNWYTASLYSDEVISVIRDSRIAHDFKNEADLLCQTFRFQKGMELKNVESETRHGEQKIRVPLNEQLWEKRGCFGWITNLFSRK